MNRFFIGIAVFCMMSVVFAQEPAPEETQLDFANSLFRRGIYDMAAEEYEKYLASNSNGPEVATALYRLGECHYTTQSYERALEVFDTLITSHTTAPERIQAELRRGEIYYRLKRLDDARAALTPLTVEGIDMQVRAGALYYLGRLYTDMDDAHAALKAFQSLTQDVPESPLTPYARYQAAFANLKLGDLENAALEFSSVASSNADDRLRSESLYRAGETYDKLGWFDAAVQCYQQLQDQFSGSEFAERGLYGHAWSLYHAKRFSDAISKAQQFISLHPDSERTTGVRYLLANCLQQQEKWQEAVNMFQAVIDRAPRTELASRSMYKIAWSYHQMGNTDEAEKRISTFVREHADSPLRGEAAFLRGSILLSQNRVAEAYEEFRLIAEKYTNSEFAAEALYKAGECLLRMDRNDEAARTFRTFAQQYPEHPLSERATLLVADREFMASAFEDAITRYSHILEDPATDPAIRGETMYRLAVIYHNMQEYEKSAGMFRRIIAEYPDSPFIAEAHLRIGDHLLRDESSAVESITAFQASLDSDPTGPYAGRAVKGLALARFLTNDHEGAARAFLRVMQEYPSVELNEKTYAWVGDYLYERQEWTESRIAFEAMMRVITDHPNPERILLRIAECTENIGDIDQALELYKKITDEAPRSNSAVEALYHMARIAEKREDRDTALAHYEAAASIGATDTAARARFRMGELYEETEEYDTAARCYMYIAFVLLHEELSPLSLIRAGACFEKAGKPDQALKMYQELVEAFPESEHAVQAARLIETTPAVDQTPVPAG